MNEWACKWISFDMSRRGLEQLEYYLRPHTHHSEELHNFYNVILNMLERLPEESSWLDE